MADDEQGPAYASRWPAREADLDETFGAVDPHRLARAARVVTERVPTLVVIQH